MKFSKEPELLNWKIGNHVVISFDPVEQKVNRFKSLYVYNLTDAH